MSTYRIDKIESKKYLDQFDESKLKLLPYRAEGLYRQSNDEWERVDKDADDLSDTFFFGERPAQWTCQIAANGFTIIVGFPDAESCYPKSWYFEKIRSVLSQLAALDAAAHARSNVDKAGEDYNEYLGRIFLNGTKLEFCYYSTTINSSWEVDFELDSTGTWSLAGALA